MEMDSFKFVFIALTIAGALVVAAFFIQARRPHVATEQPNPELVKATGKCASCHRRETPAIVAEYQRSEPINEGTNCLDCYRSQEGQSVGRNAHGDRLPLPPPNPTG